MSRSLLRPISFWRYLADQPWPGRFHCWSGLSEHAQAIVEDDHGRIYVIPARQVRFLDVPGESGDPPYPATQSPLTKGPGRG